MLNRDDFIGRNDTILIRARNLGELKGIFFADGFFWKEQRRFSLRHLRDYGFGRRSENIENFMASEMRNLIDILNKKPQKNMLDVFDTKGRVLLPDIFYGPLLNTIFQILASSRFDDRKLRDIARAALQFQRASDVSGNAISITPWLRFLAPNFFGYQPAVNNNQVMLDFLKNIIDDHIKTFSDDYHRDLIDDYISDYLNKGESIDYNHLWLTILDYMFPVPIAIGHTLNFYFIHLINNQNVQNKVQNEIDKIVGRSRLPNLDDRKFMPYTEASIRESIRTFPINPLGIPRRCVRDTTLGGYFIPKDTIMLPCVFNAHMDEKVWNEPNKFYPERFLDNDGNLLKKDNTMGFGNGKRLCAGETFARQNMFLIITGLLQNFSIKSWNNKPVDLENIVPGANLSINDNWIQTTSR